MQIIITTDNGMEQVTVVGDMTAEDALQAHGYDPNNVTYTVKKSVGKRMENLEKAVGVGGSGKSGIASRLDDLEQRISDLEN